MSGRFYNYRNELYSGRPTSWFGEPLFVFMFVILSSLAALFALVPAKREESFQRHAFYSKTPIKPFLLKCLSSILQIDRHIVLFWFFLKLEILFHLSLCQPNLVTFKYQSVLRTNSQSNTNIHWLLFLRIGMETNLNRGWKPKCSNFWLPFSYICSRRFTKSVLFSKYLAAMILKFN